MQNYYLDTLYLLLSTKFYKTKNYNELLSIDGIGETQVKSIKFFTNDINVKVLNELGKF